MKILEFMRSHYRIEQNGWVSFWKVITCFFACCILSISHAFTQVKNDTIKVLAIGNSFSQDAVEQNLYDLAKADGIVMIIGNMYIAGCSLERHVKNVRNNAPDYLYRKVKADGTKEDVKGMTLTKALLDEPWDYISFQQSSPLSGIYESYEEFLPELVDYVKAHVRGTPELLFHQTWAYASDCTLGAFNRYNRDQMKMYSQIVDAVEKATALVGIKKIIPAGTAIQNARTSFIGDHMNRDGYHLDLTVGRYTAACVWYETLTKQCVVGNIYSPKDMPQGYKEVAQAAAHAAAVMPDQITDLSNMFNK